MTDGNMNDILDILTKEINDTNIAITSQVSKINDLLGRSKMYHSQKKNLEKKIKGAEDQLNVRLSEISNLNKVISKLDADKKASGTNSTMAEERIAKLLEQVTNLKDDIRKLNDKRDEDIKNLKEKIESIKTIKQRIESSQGDIENKMALLHNEDRKDPPVPPAAPIDFTPVIPDPDTVPAVLDDDDKKVGGKKNKINKLVSNFHSTNKKWRTVAPSQLFGGYSRDSLNNMAKKWGINNPKSFKKKKDLQVVMKLLMHTKNGGIRSRTSLNQIAGRCYGLKASNYRTKKDLQSKLKSVTKKVRFNVKK